MEPNSPPADANPAEDLLLLQRVNRELLSTNQKQQREIEQLQHRLHLLLKQLYGPRSEKMSGPGLFDDCEPPDEPTPAPEPEPPPEPPQPAGPGHGRRPLPTDLPRVRIDHDLSEAEKLCPCCRTPRVKVGEEVSEQLDYRPASLFVVERHRAKYLCRTCEPLQHQTAPMPPSPIDKGMPGPGLLSHLVTSKYADHLPLHRLEGILCRHGVAIARSTMSHWMAAAAQLLTVLYDRMLQRIRRSRVIHTDDTTVPVLDPLLNHTKQGRLWVYLGDRHHPLVVFDYTPTHARDGPERILAGYEGHLQADALPGYNGLYTGGAIHEVACWAHARRKFVDAKSSDAARAHTALGFIGQLYDLEANLKEKTDSERSASRQSHALPVLARLRAWLEEQRFTVLPKSPLRQAIEYALGNFDALVRYTEAGYLNIDNNLAERTLRLIAVGRKNWMFAGSDQGAKTAAVLFSFTASCKHLEIDPFAYLRDLFTHLPAMENPSAEQLDFWLPDAWRNRQIAAKEERAEAASPLA
jgi:transposase